MPFVAIRVCVGGVVFRTKWDIHPRCHVFGKSRTFPEMQNGQSPNQLLGTLPVSGHGTNMLRLIHKIDPVSFMQRKAIYFFPTPGA